MASAETPTVSNSCTTALKRKRRGWRSTAKPAITVAPMKPSRPYKVLKAVMTASPTSPATRAKGLIGWGRIATG